jgi:malate dehydrogenase
MEYKKESVKVCITGGTGNVGYALAFMIGQGRLLGLDTRIDLSILEASFSKEKGESLLMELNDCAFPCLNSVISTLDPPTAFKDCEIAILVGSKPRGPGMTRGDLLKANANIFREQASEIETYAKKDCKVLVVGNPANTNAAIIAHYAPSLNKRNITCLTRLDMNRAKNQVAEKLELSVDHISNVIIWGNHSGT